MKGFKPDTDGIEAEVRKQQQRGADRVKATGEVFTPMPLARKMVADIPEEKKRDPQATFLDPSCGDGNFLVALVDELSRYHDRNHVLNEMVFGVDLMTDNVATAKERLGLLPDSEGWFHVVCADALAYDYSFPSPKHPKGRGSYSFSPPKRPKGGKGFGKGNGKDNGQ